MSFWTVASKSKSSVSFLLFLRKYWYLIVLVIVLLPSLISSIKVAVEDKNPTYPAFVLASSLMSADQVLEHDVILLEEDPALLVGMEKPTVGIWNRFKYGWLYFWNVIWKILGSVWMIFFPF